MPVMLSLRVLLMQQQRLLPCRCLHVLLLPQHHDTWGLIRKLLYAWCG
jgi:hypothetical protein